MSTEGWGLSVCSYSLLSPRCNVTIGIMTRHFPEETLGQRIGRLRTRCGWTQQQLAERIAASRVAISHFEMGLALPSERTIILLAGLFKIEPHELVAGTAYPEAKTERLPLTALRYSENELQIALMRRDLAWAARLDPSEQHQITIKWRERFSSLLAITTDSAERKLLAETLAELQNTNDERRQI